MHPAENGDGQTSGSTPADATGTPGAGAPGDVSRTSGPIEVPAAAPGAPRRADDRTPGDVPVADVVRVRRAPRYRRFVQVGVLLGVVIGVLVVPLLADAGGGPEEGSTRVVLLFVVVGLALVGALLGAVIAVVLDRASRR